MAIYAAVRRTNHTHSLFSLLELPVRLSLECKVYIKLFNSFFLSGQKCRTHESTRKGKSIIPVVTEFSVVEKNWKVSFCLKEGNFIFVVVSGSLLQDSRSLVNKSLYSLCLCSRSPDV